MTQVQLKSYCRNCGTKPAISSTAREARASFALASKILGRKTALFALSRMAKKLKIFSGEYTPHVYEQIIDTSLSVLGRKAISWHNCQEKYKAHQKALHSLRDCLNCPEYWAVKGGV